MKPFPSLPTVLGNRKCSDFTHSHRTDYYDLSEGPILTFLSGAHRDIPIGRQHAVLLIFIARSSFHIERLLYPNPLPG
jgi:hypothetical protein